MIFTFCAFTKSSGNTTSADASGQGASMMFCRECGEKLPEGSKFCPYCGTPVAVDGKAVESQNTEAPGNSIVGTWEAEVFGIKLGYVFNADGTYENFAQSPSLQDTYGSYTYDGKKLTLNSNDGVTRVIDAKITDNRLFIKANFGSKEMDTIFTRTGGPVVAEPQSSGSVTGTAVNTPEGISSEELDRVLSLGEQDRFEYAVGLYRNRNYNDALKVFESLGKYETSITYLHLCYAHTMEYKDLPSNTLQILNKETGKNFEDLDDVRNQVFIEKVNYYCGEGNDPKVAFSTLNTFLRDAPQYSDLYQKTAKKLYEHAKKLYSKRDYSGAYLEFGSLQDYKDSDKWLMLSDLRRNSRKALSEADKVSIWIKENIDFADVKDLVFEYPYYLGFFVGTWSNGLSYFTMKSDSTIIDNLPRIALDGAEGYKFTKNDIVLYKGSQEKKAYNITILSDYAIDIYCYKDGTTYRLVRQ